MPVPSRNDPCPCGSGKKYKRCCGAASPTSPERAQSGAYGERDRDRALARLIAFGLQPDFEDHRRICHERLWGPYAGPLRDPGHEVWKTWEIAADCTFHHALVDVPLDAGQTVLDLMLANPAARLAPPERRFLADFSRSCLSLYEIERVEPGKGFEVLDLWRHGTLWIDERSASQQVERWDLLAARLLVRPDGRNVIDNDLWHFRPHRKAELIGALEAEHAEFRRKHGDAPPEVFLKLSSHVFAQAWAKDVFEPRSPQLATFDGEAIEPTEERYEIRSFAALRRALERVEALHPEAKDVLVWTVAVGDVRHWLGSLTLKGRHFVANTMARRHAGELRTLLEREAGDAIRWMSGRTYTAAEWFEKGKELGPPTATPMSPGERAIARRAEEEHYRGWVDVPVPALDGRTPRAAALDPSCRQRVAGLLKDFENRMRHRQRAGGPDPIDLAPIWSELGLEAPEPLRGGLTHADERADVDLVALLHEQGSALFEGRLRSRFKRLLAIVRAAAQAEPHREHLSALACSRRPNRKACVGKLLILVEGPEAPLRWRCAVCGDQGGVLRWSEVLEVIGRDEPARAAVTIPAEVPLDADVWRALYAQATRFKALAPWEWMLDGEIFGVEDPASGEIGWCCVLGAAGELAGLAVYRGPSGFDLWRRVHEAHFRQDEALFGQDALVLAFVDRAELSPLERARIQRLGLRFRGKGEWPQIDSHAYGRMPRPVDEVEARRMALTLQQAIAVATRARSAEGLLEPDVEGRLLVRKCSKSAAWPERWDDQRVAPPPRIERPVPAFDRELASRLRAALPSSPGRWEFDVRASPSVITGEGGDPYVPACFLIVDVRMGVPVHVGLERPGDLQALAQSQLLAAVERVGLIPARIEVARPWVEACLRPVAAALGARVVLVAELDALEEVEEKLQGFLGQRAGRFRR